jgi:hypothetical protein
MKKIEVIKFEEKGRKTLYKIFIDGSFHDYFDTPEEAIKEAERVKDNEQFKKETLIHEIII